MSKKTQFLEDIKRLGRYFSVDITKEIVEAYYDQLYYIEPETFTRIVTNLIADKKPFKSNFPTITQFGPLYESQKPQQNYTKPEFEHEDCPECHGEGLIYYKFWHFKHGLVYQSFVICASCQNWRKHFNAIGPYQVRSGDGRFLYNHPGIEATNRESLCLKTGVLEVPEDGVFRLTREQLSKRVEEFYGNFGQ